MALRAIQKGLINVLTCVIEGKRYSYDEKKGGTRLGETKVQFMGLPYPGLLRGGINILERNLMCALTDLRVISLLQVSKLNCGYKGGGTQQLDISGK